MASNITHMDEWSQREVSKMMRKQKRAKDIDLLKPQGHVIRKKEPAYRRKGKTAPHNIPMADIKPVVEVIETNIETGESNVVYSRDFQKEPLMKNEQINHEVAPDADQIPSTYWEDAVEVRKNADESMSNLIKAGWDGTVDGPAQLFGDNANKEPVKETQPESAEPNQPEVVEVAMRTSGSGRKQRAWVYGILTTAVVVGSVFAYLHLSKKGE